MRLKTLELNGFKSFAQKTILEFDSPVVCVVGPNGSGKSNVVEAIRYVLGEQSMKSMRGKSGLDLIFKGSKNLSGGSRASVSIYFNNSDKIFKLENDGGDDINLNYDTISITRQVFSDGLNKYILNGTEVRLKDIHNLLASVNIGSSGHHIISQGEADRILNASPKDRKEMVEDALGLKIYQYKIKESERKLERTENNMKEVTMLRRENAPHLNFLKKQVEKFEKAKEMQIELATLYREYLKKESVYLDTEKNSLLTEKNKLRSELEIIAGKISIKEDDNSGKGNPPRLGEAGNKIDELRIAENSLNSIRGTKSEMERKLGRIEGMIEAKQNRVKISGRCPTCGRELGEINKEQIENRENNEKELLELKNSQTAILSEMQKMGSDEKKLLQSIELLKEDLNKEMAALRDLEREKFKFRVRHQELTSALELVNMKEGNLKARIEAFENEIKEGVALIGQEILDYKTSSIKDESTSSGQILNEAEQAELKKKIDRIKIKLEDAGLGGGAEVLKEFKEVSERDEFLAKEMEDLTKSIESLQKLITDLKEKIDIEFKEGVKKINVEFQEFFSLMFGGGTGSLAIVVEDKRRKRVEHDSDESDEELELELEDEEITPEQGIEINVSLPHKKVKELHALSGGERSLTSIALLFAMSQVNPPPFLVLDETDAALDESNSRKYGDMLEKLSKHSQLIVVTHNRETMSRAGVLYGVTIGSNGASKLLSVKFEEATQIAK